MLVFRIILHVYQMDDAKRKLVTSNINWDVDQPIALNSLLAFFDKQRFFLNSASVWFNFLMDWASNGA